jgi:hypothetical protein
LRPPVPSPPTTPVEPPNPPPAVLDPVVPELLAQAAMTRSAPARDAATVARFVPINRIGMVKTS